MKRQILALAIVLLGNAAMAGTVTTNGSVPSVDGGDIANLGAATGNTDKLWNDNFMQGQTFTNGASAKFINALTIQIFESDGTILGWKDYRIRFGTVSGSTFSPIYDQSMRQNPDVPSDVYFTFTPSSPIDLSPNTLYAFEISLSGSDEGWQDGIPRGRTNGVSFSDGSYFTSARQNQLATDASSTMSMQSGDLVFHLDMEVVPPSVSISNTPVSAIGSTSATFNATVDIVNTNADVLVYWGRTNEVNDTNAWEFSSPVDNYSTGSSSISFSTNGLLANTQYFYRFRATNDTTNVWASTSESFYTEGPPAVTNVGETDMAAGVATLRGELTGGSTANAYFYWGLSDGNTDTNAWDNEIPVGNVNESVTFSNSVSELLYGHTYYYRVFVTNDLGGAWSAQDTFSPPAPQGGTADEATAGFDVFLDATTDDASDGTWTDTQDYWNLTKVGSVTHVPNAGSSLPGITSAFDFTGGTGGTDGFDGTSLGDLNQDTKPVSMEIWFKPDGAADDGQPNGQILYETGGGQGIGIVTTQVYFDWIYRINGIGTSVIQLQKRCFLFRQLSCIEVWNEWITAEQAGQRIHCTDGILAGG